MALLGRCFVNLFSDDANIEHSLLGKDDAPVSEDLISPFICASCWSRPLTVVSTARKWQSGPSDRLGVFIMIRFMKTPFYARRLSGPFEKRMENLVKT